MNYHSLKPALPQQAPIDVISFLFVDGTDAKLTESKEKNFLDGSKP